MTVFGQSGQLDGQIWDEVLQEVSPLTEELAVVQRFTGLTAGDPAAGKGAVPTYITFNTLAEFTGVTPQEIAFPNSIYTTGDVHGLFKIEMFGAGGIAGGDAQAANRRSDLVTWRGRSYKIEGHPDRVHFGGIYYWNCLLRQEKAS